MGLTEGVVPVVEKIYMGKKGYRSSPERAIQTGETRSLQVTNAFLCGWCNDLLLVAAVFPEIEQLCETV